MNSPLTKFKIAHYMKPLTSVAIRVFGTGTGFIVSILIARFLGAEDAGLYFLAISIVTFLAVSSRVGLDMIIIKYTGRFIDKEDKGTAKDILIKATLISMPIALTISATIFLFSDTISLSIFEKAELGPVLRNLSFSVIALTLIAILAMSMQGLQKSVLSVFTQTISLNLVLISYLLLVTNEVSHEDLARMYTTTVLLILLTGYLFWYHYLPRIAHDNPRIGYSEVLSSSMPLWFFTMTNQIIQLSGVFIIGIFESSDDIAIFSVAQRVANMLTILFVSINMVVAPKLSQLALSGSKKDTIIELRKAIFITSAVSFVPVLIFILGSKFIMNVFGAEFESGSILLVIMVIGYTFNIITGPLEVLLSMTGKEKYLRNIAFFLGPIALILNVLLIYSYGVLGGAFATAGVLVLQKTVVIYLVNKELNITLYELWKPASNTYAN